MAEKSTTDIQEILELMREPTESNIALVKKAYAFAQKAHEGEMRFSGDAYFSHAFEASKNLAKFGMDAASIAAGFLHDTLEDGNTDEKTLEKEFGKEIAFLVDGVTKLGKLKYRGLERHAESLRKLFVATAQDARVLIIKLADRLHNIQTLDGHPKKEKRHRIAVETLEIYAPLADRLGMGLLKGELEDYAFPHVFPKEYKQVKELMTKKREDHKKYLEKFHRSLQKELAQHQSSDIKTSYRVKHLYSLYQKLQRKDWDIDKIYDITAIRVITDTIEECYRVLGIIHSIWRPLPGRIKDYIALPKPNGYQSIHTTVFTGDGGIVEVQIRTKEMHHDAEYGIASHLAYKKGLFDRLKPTTNDKEKVIKNKLGWIDELIEWQEQVSENTEFLKELSIDFFKYRVFVFTPRGDTIDMPEDSTPVDFAYMIHSDIGNHMSSAKVNGKMSSIKTKLHNGDIVEIMTNKNSRPSQKWLEYAKTSIAQRHIRVWLQKNKKEN
ncbi:MAG: bifunctional (p)ppGpp synthetase/guanosine-3',5'-bis(diphosphate) 3'-pyrophosphohydrolase [Candidatus Pacebacteria bacterium]|nr:bifunctional (p)ppGpp synthetase/guanosine-3',5'-bis(diphosphate) 3'-pyrophosphohydrolase [Candidatus Paceibacterota bacterium]